MISYIALFTAISISAVAAYYSIVGLTAIFSSAFWPIVIMGSVLEVGKLVSASWLYRNWKYTPKLLKYYLTSAIIILMIITSMGIFGFLSRAHIEHTVTQDDSSGKIQLIERKVGFEQSKIKDAERILEQLDASVDKLLEYDKVSGKGGALAIRQSQKQERQELLKVIQESMETISTYQLEVEELNKEKRIIEAEVGPLKYIAELLYGEQARSHLESTVRVVIILIVSAFDPLAVMLLIAANISLTRERMFGHRSKLKPFTLNTGKGKININI